MKQSIPLRLGALLLAGTLAACTSDASPSPSTDATPATPSPTTTPSQSAEQTDEATPSPEAPASADESPGGGFAIAPHPEADSLFLSREECENREDGYRLEFPAEWSANDNGGSLPPCSWFAEDPFTVDDPTDIPDEVAITIELLEGDTATRDDVVSEDEVIVGGTQTATRAEFEDEGTTMFEYVVQLGPPGEGPVLLARTDTDMGGDYDLNKAVLDRIMATMEFIGTTQ